MGNMARNGLGSGPGPGPDESGAGELPELTDCPYYLITRTSLLVTAALKRELREAGVEKVRPAYLGVLMSLWRQDGLNVTELGRRAGLEPSTMTGLLDRMERDELVVRSADPADRRAHRIELTGFGRRAERTVTEIVDRALAKAMEGIDESDVEHTKSVLRRVLINARGLHP